MMDSTKKMYIDQILNRNVLFNSYENYYEYMEGEKHKKFDKEEMKRRREENQKKIKESQDFTYFDKLHEAIEVYHDANRKDNEISRLVI